MNLPNKLSLTRIILLPFMMFCYLATFIPQGYGKIAALVIFIVASITDLLDGQIARKRNLITDFGKFIDTIADKVLTFTALFMFMVDGTIPQPYGVIFAFVTILRDFIVMGIKSLCGSKGRVMCAEQVGRIKFFISTLAYPIGFLIPIFHGFAIGGTLLLVTQIVFYVLIGATALLTIYSGIYYIVKYRDIFTEI